MERIIFLVRDADIDIIYLIGQTRLDHITNKIICCCTSDRIQIITHATENKYSVLSEI
jgi:hypothetical protein